MSNRILRVLSCLVLVGFAVTAHAQANAACPGFTARLSIGGAGRVTPGASNNLRDQPNKNGALLAKIPAGGQFTVLDGPQCDGEGRTWWQVQYGDKTGWTVEGAGTDYFLEPLLPTAGATPATTPAKATCPGTVPTRLKPLAWARVQAGSSNNLRSTSSADGKLKAAIPSGDLLQVQGSNAHCDEAGRIWWFVESNGNYGWTVEAQGDSYFLDPADAPMTLPADTEVITKDNIAGVKLLAVLPKVTDEGRQLFPFSGVWSPDGRTIATADQQGALLYDVSALGEPRRLASDLKLAAYSPSFQAAFSPDSRLVALGSADSKVSIWEVETAALVKTLEHPQRQRVAAVAFSPDGKWLATAGSEYDKPGNSAVILWDAKTFEQKAVLGRFDDFSPDIGSLLFSPDSTLLAAAQPDNAVIVYDVVKAEERYHFSNSHAPIIFTPDGTLVGSIIGNQRATAVQWAEAATGKPKNKRDIDGTEVRSLTFSPDGSILLIAGDDVPGVNANTIGLRAWDFRRQTLITRWDVGLSAAFSPNGKLLLVDGMELWGVPPE
jgi:WD40 repeat protein